VRREGGGGGGKEKRFVVWRSKITAQVLMVVGTEIIEVVKKQG
jgi:hypothetical protein